MSPFVPPRIQPMERANGMLDPETVKTAVRTATPTDEQVVARVLAGETELFELVMRRHNQRVYRAIRSVVRTEAEVEDVMQQAYLQAFAHLKDFSGRSTVSTWLIRIAMNEALMRTRKAARLTLVPDLTDRHLESAMSSPPNDSPEERAHARELSSFLETAVDALPELYRTVFVLRDIEGLSTAETAEVLEVSEDVVKTRLHRAKSLVRDALFEQVTGTADDAFVFRAPRCDRIVQRVMSAVLTPR